MSPIICQKKIIAKEIFLFTIFFILYWDTLFQIARLFWTVVSLKKLPIRLNVFFLKILFHKTNRDMSNKFHITFKKCYKVKNINNSLRVLKKWKETKHFETKGVDFEQCYGHSCSNTNVPNEFRCWQGCAWSDPIPVNSTQRTWDSHKASSPDMSLNVWVRIIFHKLFYVSWTSPYIWEVTPEVQSSKLCTWNSHTFNGLILTYLCQICTCKKKKIKNFLG